MQDALAGPIPPSSVSLADRATHAGFSPDEVAAALSLDRELEADYVRYRKVLLMIALWLGLAVLVMINININIPPSDTPRWEHPSYAGRNGYTWSLLFVVAPMLFVMLVWYPRRQAKKIRGLLVAALTPLVVTAPAWILLDVFFAHRFFEFPDPRSRALFNIPGYSWAGPCSSITNLFDWSCYRNTIPVEEVIFYVSSGAVLTLLYMWATEDFFSRYTLELTTYRKRAKITGPLVHWNWTIILIGMALAVVGIIAKQQGPRLGFNHAPDGWPLYFLAQIPLVFVPLAALYDRVHSFTNPRAFLFVMVTVLLVDLMWEATLAVPYGWWGYQHAQMIGITVTAWSRLPIEAIILWLAVGWGSMFLYETSKIKVVTGRTWWQTLFVGHGSAPVTRQAA